MADLHVVATIHPLPGRAAAVLEVLQTILTQTQAEAGCLRFDLHRGLEENPDLYLIESWTNEEALQAHHAMPYTVAAAERLDGLLAAPTEVLRMIAA